MKQISNEKYLKDQDSKKTKTIIAVLSVLLAIFFLTTVILLNQKPSMAGANAALIHIDGEILSGTSGGYQPGYVFSDDVTSQIEEISKNPSIKAIIFEINSPGGSAVGSSEIAYAVYKARTSGKKTVALIRESGASGAYWIASACDHVIAHPMAITGSVGVLASYLEFSGLLDRFNITYEQLNGGVYKDTMSPYRELGDRERAILQNKVNMIHSLFLNQVAQSRNLSADTVKEISTGMFYLGTEAKDLGLVDELGIKEDAIRYLEKELNTKVKIREYDGQNSILIRLSGVQSQVSFWIGKGIGTALLQNKNVLNIKA
jgi:protease-4